MKTKFFTLIAAFMFACILTNAQGSNAPEGSVNFYESLYGTVQGANRGATDALYYCDYLIENDFAVAGLVNLGYTVTVATDWGDFNNQIISGNFNLAVAFVQNSCGGPSAANAQTFITGGGYMIYCDWCRDNTFANLFEANYTGGTNQNQVTILDPGIAGGITNPVLLSNPGWGVFSTDMSAIGNGEVLATFGNGSAAMVRGNDGRTLILGYLSDTPPSGDRQQLFENVVTGGLGNSVPVSDWAIYLGLILIAGFAAFRYFKVS